MLKSPRGARLLAAAVAVVALASACGGSSSKSSSSSGSASQPSAGGSSAPAATKAPVKIGLLTDATGTGGPSVKYSVDVVKAWGKWVNETGGLNGHPVTISVQDTKSDPAAAIAGAQKLLQSEKVDLFLLGSPTAELAAGKQIAASGVPVMGYGYTPIW